MPFVQNLCDFCIKTIPICWISSSYVSWVVSYIHLDIQAVFLSVLCWATMHRLERERLRLVPVYSGAIPCINALVLGSTYWSHCLNAYSFNAFYIARKPQFIYRMIDVHLQWDTRPPTHPWTATLLCYTGRQYVSWLWLNCHNAFYLRCLKQCLFWLPFKVL